MENSGGGAAAQQAAKKDSGELPTETSPYTQYKDLEDYKLQGYGAQGHLNPKPGRGSGATDAPTASGGAPVSAAADAIRRHLVD